MEPPVAGARANREIDAGRGSDCATGVWTHASRAQFVARRACDGRSKNLERSIVDLKAG